MTATATATATILRLPDFESPAIPDGYKLTMIDLTRSKGLRYHRLYPDNYPSESAMIDAACLYIIQRIGWANARIEFVLERITDGSEGRMVYECDFDKWTNEIPNRD